jgi:hypothetical protein
MAEELIPVTMFICGAAIAIVAIVLHSKRNQLDHQERILALEKGQPLPEKPLVPAREKNPYFWGFVFIAVGLALTWYFFMEYNEEWFWGPSILLVGIAVLTANLLHRRDMKKLSEAEKGKYNGKVELVNDNGSGGPAA